MSTQAPPGRPVAIECVDVRKSFPIPSQRMTTLKERVMHPGTWFGQEVRLLDTLTGVSFEVARGEFFGVIGRNGSGKSTLLKLLASIYGLDGGSVRVAGSIAPFIELGVGFSPELNARDNVVLNGTMMGLSPAEARSRYEAVLDYAELWDYTDLKLKNYSSGMQVRLAFALMLQVEADILVVDEVLAVGDAAFQAKCLESLEEIKRRGTTVVLVTHDMDAVVDHCDRAILLEGGRIASSGDPGKVAARYLEVLFTTEEDEPVMDDSPAAAVTSAWLSAQGSDEPVESVDRADGFTVNLSVTANRTVEGVQLLLELTNNPEGVAIASFPVGYDEGLRLAAGREVTLRFAIEPGSLHTGSYRFRWLLGTPDRLLDRSREPLPLRITGRAAPGAGLVDVPHTVEVQDGDTERRP